MLNWMGVEAHPRLSDMFNHALQHGMPYDDWTTNWKNLGAKWIYSSNFLNLGECYMLHAYGQ